VGSKAVEKDLFDEGVSAATVKVPVGGDVMQGASDACGEVPDHDYRLLRWPRD